MSETAQLSPDEAAQIANNLGTTIPELDEVASRVDAYVSLCDNEVPVRTSLEYADGEFVHLHQLIREIPRFSIGNEKKDVPWIVTDVNSLGVTVKSTDFSDSKTLSKDDLQSEQYDVAYADGDVIWAY